MQATTTSCVLFQRVMLTSVLMRNTFNLPALISITNSFNGWRLTLIDSLDTMWIMGLHHEFQESMSIVSNLNFTLDEVGVFVKFGEFLTNLHRTLTLLFSKQLFGIWAVCFLRTRYQEKVYCSEEQTS
jgi:hypothetical protein